MFWKRRSASATPPELHGGTVEAAARHPAFAEIDKPRRGGVTTQQVMAHLRRYGLLEDDDRIQPFLKTLAAETERRPIGEAAFAKLLKDHHDIISRALSGGLVIPDFPSFASAVELEYQSVRTINQGAVAKYIPELARADHKACGVAMCTIDGQRALFGDAKTPFTVQSVSKLALYCLALELYGRDTVHQFVGREPSGQRFNALTLNDQNLPHNPMINAGAIACSSIILPDKALPQRFEALRDVWQTMAGGRPFGFSTQVYTSERQSADQNFALAYFMKENKVFPPASNMMETLDLYFQACAMEADVDRLALAAATLANGGVCPLTGKQAVHNRHVKNCLSMMFTNGMYNYSGEFAFLVGLPAKSGVSGVIVAVVPGLLGLAIWSPPVDDKGNSVRGVELCKRLTAKFNFHTFDGVDQRSGKIDPRQLRSAKR